MERVGHPDLRKFLVERCSADGDGVPRRTKMPESGSTPFQTRSDHGRSELGAALNSHLPAAECYALGSLVDRSLWNFCCLSLDARPGLEAAGGRTGRSRGLSGGY